MPELRTIRIGLNGQIELMGIFQNYLGANLALILSATAFSSQMKLTLSWLTVASAQRLKYGACSRRAGNLALTSPCSGLLKSSIRSKNEPDWT